MFAWEWKSESALGKPVFVACLAKGTQCPGSEELLVLIGANWPRSRHLDWSNLSLSLSPSLSLSLSLIVSLYVYTSTQLCQITRHYLNTKGVHIHTSILPCPKHNPNSFVKVSLRAWSQCFWRDLEILKPPSGSRGCTGFGAVVGPLCLPDTIHKSWPEKK